MKIVQISDLHFTRFSLNPLFFRLKRCLGMLNWLFFRRNDFHHDHLELLPILWKELNVDLILVGGDLTTTALPNEFTQAKKFFDQCNQNLLFVPGNHDHYTKESYRNQRFYRVFSNKKAEDTSLSHFSLQEHGVEAHRIAPLWWCVALDTAPPTSLFSSAGFFAPRTEQNLEQVLQQIPKNERILMLNHFPIFQNESPQHGLFRSESLRSLIERHANIVVYLHGHTHRHSIADLQVNSLPLILDSGCSVQRGCATWNLLDLNEEGCKVQMYQWKEKEWQIGRETVTKWMR